MVTNQHIDSHRPGELRPLEPEKRSAREIGVPLSAIPRKIRVIVNPRSCSGKTKRKWKVIDRQLKKHLESFDAVFTKGPLDASRLTAAALKEGVEQIIAVGGDGTLNEVVNGFFEKGQPINPQAILSHISSGTGSDFSRSLFSSRNLEEQINCLARGQVRPVDVGCVTFHDDGDNGMKSRYFINASSCGLSGTTCRVVNEQGLLKKLGGKIAFQWAVLSALFRYKTQRLRLQVDSSFDEEIEVNTIAVCNGRYFGSGMNIAPEAHLNDGLLDVIVLKKLTLFQILKWFPMIYKGTHLKKEELVLALRGKSIKISQARIEGEAFIEVDGESPGRLPAFFEILPQAILVKS
jgi:diacylglycerol kinase (ATP)